jgi:hypothetical protein
MNSGACFSVTYEFGALSAGKEHMLAFNMKVYCRGSKIHHSFGIHKTENEKCADRMAD